MTYAIRAFAARHGNVRFRSVCMSRVDAPRRRVSTGTGEEIEYDYVVLCRGVITGRVRHRRPAASLR